MTKYKLSELKDLLFNANYILKVLKVTQLTLSVVLETELQPTLNTALWGRQNWESNIVLMKKRAAY